MKDTSRIASHGFVNPEYLILIALLGIGIASVTPILEPLLSDGPISVWHWAGLGVGTVLVAGCVAYYVIYFVRMR